MKELIISILKSSGITVKELCNLNRSDIDLQTLTVKVNHRITVIDGYTSYLLMDYLSTRTDDNPSLLCLTPKEVKRIIGKHTSYRLIFILNQHTQGMPLSYIVKFLI